LIYRSPLSLYERNSVDPPLHKATGARFTATGNEPRRAASHHQLPQAGAGELPPLLSLDGYSCSSDQGVQEAHNNKDRRAVSVFYGYGRCSLTNQSSEDEKETKASHRRGPLVYDSWGRNALGRRVRGSCEIQGLKGAAGSWELSSRGGDRELLLLPIGTRNGAAAAGALVTVRAQDRRLQS